MLLIVLCRGWCIGGIGRRWNRIPSAKPITIRPCSRQRVVCGARADLALEGPARNGKIIPELFANQKGREVRQGTVCRLSAKGF